MKTIRVHVTIWTMWCESLRACESNTSIKDDENLLLYFDFVMLRDYLLKFHMHQNFLFEKTFTKQFHVYVYYKPLTLTSQQIIRDMTFITSQGWNKFQLFSFAKSLEIISLLSIIAMSFTQLSDIASTFIVVSFMLQSSNSMDLK